MNQGRTFGQHLGFGIGACVVTDGIADNAKIACVRATVGGGWWAYGVQASEVVGIKGGFLVRLRAVMQCCMWLFASTGFYSSLPKSDNRSTSVSTSSTALAATSMDSVSDTALAGLDSESCAV